MPLNTCRTLRCGWDWQELQVAETGKNYRRRSERNEKIYFEQVSAYRMDHIWMVVWMPAILALK